jgi:methylenetetrahydrofolate reductase (NADPH)
MEGVYHRSVQLISDGRMMFLQDEAFSIWTDWARQFSPDSQERLLLENVRDTRWLVNVTHHDFKDPGALWTFLFEDIGLDDASLT